MVEIVLNFKLYGPKTAHLDGKTTTRNRIISQQGFIQTHSHKTVVLLFTREERETGFIVKQKDDMDGVTIPTPKYINRKTTSTST